MSEYLLEGVETRVNVRALVPEVLGPVVCAVPSSSLMKASFSPARDMQR